MSDIALVWNEFEADLAIEGADLAADEGLETAVLISLFTDRRAAATDVLPTSDDDRRGWWGDTFAEIDGDQDGSRLWLLEREKELPIVVKRAKQYAFEALEWMLSDRVASRVDVEAEIVAPGLLGLGVVIHRHGRPSAGFRYDYNWIQQSFKRAV